MNRQRADGTITGPFGLCSEIWDKKTNQYIRATDLEIFNCCMNTNLPLVEKCVQKCHMLGTKKLRKNCAMTCHDISKIIIDNCMLSSEFWDTDKNPIFKAAKNYGCGDGLFRYIDTKCMEKNKEDILKVCKRKCIPGIATDCDKNCDFSYNFLVDPDIAPLKKQVIKLNNELDSDASNPTETANDIYIGYVFGFMLLLYILLRCFV